MNSRGFVFWRCSGALYFEDPKGLILVNLQGVTFWSLIFESIRGSILVNSRGFVFYIHIYIYIYTRPLRGLVWYSAFAAVPPTRALRSRNASHRVCIFCITSNRIHCVDIDPTWKRKVLCRAEYSPCWASRGANLAPVRGT